VPNRYEIRLAGTGGQGLILAGIILAEAAAIYDGKNAVQSQSYGPEARGGTSKTEVIIADDEIDYPKVTSADILLAMSQEACDKYFYELKKDGLLIVDATHVHRVPTTKAVSLAITQLALEATGRRITASITALGVIAELTGVVSHQALEAAVLARAPRGTQEVNRQALEAGFRAAEEFRSKKAS
jgi:2-oxoglutarate ferredoxin oxidoreductase subunit gamma